MKAKLKAHGTKLLRLKDEKLLLKFAFSFNLRHYTTSRDRVGRRSNPIN